MTMLRFKPFNSNLAPFNATKFYNWPLQNVTDFIGSDFAGSAPAVNVKETSVSWNIEMAAPGLKKESFSIEVEKNTLVVSTSQPQKTEFAQPENTVKTNAEVVNNSTPEFRYVRREFNFVSFERSFKLPNNVDTTKIEATYTDGILNIAIPKRAEEQTPLKTRINIA